MKPLTFYIVCLCTDGLHGFFDHNCPFFLAKESVDFYWQEFAREGSHIITVTTVFESAGPNKTERIGSIEG